MLQCLPFISLEAKLILTPGPLHMSFLPRDFSLNEFHWLDTPTLKTFQCRDFPGSCGLGLRVSTSGHRERELSVEGKIMHVVHCSQKEKNKQNPQANKKYTNVNITIFRRPLKSSSAPTLPTSSLLLFSFIAF